MTADTCRKPGCGAPILWARTAAGKAMPVDPEPYLPAAARPTRWEPSA